MDIYVCWRVGGAPPGDSEPLKWDSLALVIFPPEPVNDPSRPAQDEALSLDCIMCRDPVSENPNRSHRLFHQPQTCLKIKLSCQSQALASVPGPPPPTLLTGNRPAEVPGSWQARSSEVPGEVGGERACLSSLLDQPRQQGSGMALSSGVSPSRDHAVTRVELCLPASRFRSLCLVLPALPLPRPCRGEAGAAGETLVCVGTGPFPRSRASRLAKGLSKLGRFRRFIYFVWGISRGYSLLCAQDSLPVVVRDHEAFCVPGELPSPKPQVLRYRHGAKHLLHAKHSGDQGPGPAGGVWRCSRAQSQRAIRSWGGGVAEQD